MQRTELRLNMGSPMSRRRAVTVRSTLLGASGDPIHCPRGEALALDFGDAEPVSTMFRILGNIGLKDPGQLRAGFGRGLAPKACAPNERLAGLDTATADTYAVLRIGFLLGLCTGVYFDPGRPVLWTQASLTRRLELFDMGGFYL
jgi:hypothetical protein